MDKKKTPEEKLGMDQEDLFQPPQMTLGVLQHSQR